ncbi:unnamed protein product [Paramecium primaurelia]|uniref:adenine phosphoribosyltransferase n=2 Tax=Paramecium TaxID=5884 RepID=A0A8S1UMI6_9CILI|nr:unnamed protein product [Paramecium primaurelia]CAD8164902.1 unnamed protein product [Paramecium pentaurelia]
MELDISQLVDKTVRSIPNYPKPGINFRDICPLLKNIEVLNKVIDYFVAKINFEFDYIAGLESRGFLFGILLSQRMNKGFIPIRKKNKLPGEKISLEYKLEYGSDIIEIQADAFEPGSKILICDDLLATGGTAVAANELINKAQGTTVGFVFVIELKDLKGKERFDPKLPVIVALCD